MPDLRTQAIVLRRTNYRESDRILDLLTPEGKQAVIARGVRKAKSRLAGGIELFTLAEVVIHQGRGDLGTLTSAKMLQFYFSKFEQKELKERLAQLAHSAHGAAVQEMLDYVDGLMAMVAILTVTVGATN